MSSWKSCSMERRCDIVCKKLARVVPELMAKFKVISKLLSGIIQYIIKKKRRGV